MKIRNHTLPHQQRGYTSLLITITLCITIMTFALTSFRETREAQTFQSNTQTRLDYSQKEQAFLRALLEIVPNAAMRGMMDQSATSSNQLSWSAIFTQALTQTGASLALDDITATDLGISSSAISANTGNSGFNLTVDNSGGAGGSSSSSSSSTGEDEEGDGTTEIEGATTVSSGLVRT